MGPAARLCPSEIGGADAAEGPSYAQRQVGFRSHRGHNVTWAARTGCKENAS